MEVNDMLDGPSDDPLLMTARELATLLRVSTRTLWRLRSAGALPQPVRFGGTVRWRHDEVRAWIAAKCPTVNGAR